MKKLIFFVIFLFSTSGQSSPVPPPILEETKSALDLFNESLSDFDNSMNETISSIYKTEPTYQLEVVYVIPKGEKSRPRANEVIKEIFSIMQKHYFKQLGVTFELKKPLITTIFYQSYGPSAPSQMGHSLRRPILFLVSSVRLWCVYLGKTLRIFFGRVPLLCS